MLLSPPAYFRIRATCCGCDGRPDRVAMPSASSAFAMRVPTSALALLAMLGGRHRGSCVALLADADRVRRRRSSSGRSARSTRSPDRGEPQELATLDFSVTSERVVLGGGSVFVTQTNVTSTDRVFRIPQSGGAATDVRTKGNVTAHAATPHGDDVYAGCDPDGILSRPRLCVFRPGSAGPELLAEVGWDGSRVGKLMNVAGRRGARLHDPSLCERFLVDDTNLYCTHGTLVLVLRSPKSLAPAFEPIAKLDDPLLRGVAADDQYLYFMLAGVRKGAPKGERPRETVAPPSRVRMFSGVAVERHVGPVIVEPDVLANEPEQMPLAAIEYRVAPRSMVVTNRSLSRWGKRRTENRARERPVFFERTTWLSMENAACSISRGVHPRHAPGLA